MTQKISSEDLMRYLDGEMPPEERELIDAQVADSTELQREVAIYRGLKSDFQELSFHPATHRNSVWDRVNQHVTRPVGWVLVAAGTTLWLIYGVYVFANAAINPWEKLATGAVAIGMMMLLASVIWERYRELGADPYKDVHR